MHKMIQTDCIERIKSAIITHEVVSDFIKLRKKGSHYESCCPFHEEKTPSFKISPSRNIYKCFSCGVAGDGLTFLMKHEKMSFVEAIKYLGQKYGIPIEYEEVSKEEAQERTAKAEKKERIKITLEKAVDFYSSNPLPKIFIDRGYENLILDVAQVGYVNEEGIKPYCQKMDWVTADFTEADITGYKNGNVYDRFKDRVMFPIHDHAGRVVAFTGRYVGDDPKLAKTKKYLNSSSKIWDKSKILYGYHIAKHFVGSGKGKFDRLEGQREDRLYLVEGITDVLRMWSKGVYNVCALLGKNITPEQLSLIKRLTNNICYIADNDDNQAGQSAIEPIAKAATQQGLSVSYFIPYSGDPDDYFEPRKGVRAVLKHAKLFFNEDYVKMVMDESKRLGAEYAAKKVKELGEFVLNIKDELNRAAYYELFAKWRLFKTQIKLPRNTVAQETSRKLTEEQMEQFAMYDLFIQDGSIWTITNHGERRVANFTFTISYFLEREGDHNSLLIHFKPAFSNQIFTVLATAVETANLNTFKRLITNVKGLIWYGTNSTEYIYQSIKDIAMQESQTAFQLETIGKNMTRNFWVWGNGITKAGQFYPVNKQGIVELPTANGGKEHFYFPWRVQQLKAAEDRHINGYTAAIHHNYSDSCQISLNELLDCIFVIHQDKAEVLFLFYLASLFWNEIHEVDEYFPILFLFGEKGSGKTNAARTLLYMFGGLRQKDGMNLTAGGTSVGMRRTMNTTSNIPFYLSEFNNHLDQRKIEFLKGLADGSGDTRGKMSNDNQVLVSEPKGATIITGNAYPLCDEALYSRCLMLCYSLQDADKWNRQKFDSFKAIMQTKQLTHITNKLLGLSDTVQKQWRKLRSEVFQKIMLRAEERKIELIDRDTNNVVPLLTIFEIAKDQFPILSHYIKADDLLEKLLDMVVKSKELVDQIDVAIDFLHTVSESKYIFQGQHYDFDREENRLFLYFNLRDTYKQIYLEECRSKGLVPERENTIRDAIKAHEAFSKYEPKNLKYAKKGRRSSGFIMDYEQLYHEHEISFNDRNQLMDAMIKEQEQQQEE